MRLAPLYQEDRARAIQEGRQEGRQEEGLSLIFRLLNRRIGSISPNLAQQIRSLPLNTLEDLGEVLLDFNSETDLSAWLSNLKS